MYAVVAVCFAAEQVAVALMFSSTPLFQAWFVSVEPLVRFELLDVPQLPLISRHLPNLPLPACNLVLRLRCL